MSRQFLSDQSLARISKFLIEDTENNSYRHAAHWTREAGWRDWLKKLTDPFRKKKQPESYDYDVPEDEEYKYEYGEGDEDYGEEVMGEPAPFAVPELEPQDKPTPLFEEPTPVVVPKEEPEVPPEIIEEKPLPKGYEDLIWIPVQSSNVSSFAYDYTERSLFVKFLAKGKNTSEPTYVYHDVEPEIYDAFIAADSKGKFVWSHLRDRYDCDRLD